MFCANVSLEVFLNGSIGPIDRTLTGTVTPGQSGLESNDNPQGSKTEVLPTDVVWCYTQDIPFGGGGVLTLCWG